MSERGGRHLIPSQVNKLDLCVWLASCFGCLFISIEIGLAIAVGLAVMIALYQSAFPHTAVLGRVAGSSLHVYRWLLRGARSCSVRGGGNLMC